MKKLLSLLTMFSIFIGGLAIADYAYIEDPDGKIHTVEMTMLSDGKFIIKMEDVSPFWITFLKSGMSHQVSNSYNFNYSSKSTDEVSIQFVYKSKRMGAKFRYNFKTGEFVYNYAKLGETANSNYNPDDYEDNNPEENTENNGTENNNTENNDTENNDTENNDTENNNTENNDTENNNTENNNTGNNDETQDTYDDSTQNSSNNDKTETVKKNTTLNLTTNDKSPEIKQYINLTIETDEDYIGKLTFSAKYRNSSSSSWNSISKTSSTYFSDYSDEWYDGYYKMKSSDNGDVTLKNFIKFNKGGDYRIYVKDVDGNEEYVTFNVYEEDENLIKDTNEIKDENQKQENEKNVNKYNNVEDYNSKIGEITNKCYAEEIKATNYYYSGTIDELKKGVNSVISTCRDVKSDLEDMGGWDGDTSFVDGAIAIIEKIVEYYEAYNKIMPFFDKEINNLSESEKKEYNSIIDELNNIESDLALLENNIYYIQDRFARREGYYTIPCSIEGTKYSDELTIAYEWACLNGITTISDINSAGLDQPLTRAQLAKMMSLFKYNILQEKPHLKPQIVYSDVSSSLGDLEGYIQIAYDYGIMGVDKDGNAIENFNPSGTLNRGDFATVFSRSLWGNKYNKEGADYYSNHLNALKNGGYMNNIDPKVLEIRGYVMLMMYRASQNISNEATSWTSLNSLIKKTTSNNTSANTSSNTSSKQTNSNQVSTSITHEEAVAAAYGNRAGASAGAIRAQQNEAYNRAVQGISSSNCGSYNPYGGESYGGWLNRCQNGSSVTDTYKVNTNSNDKMYEALSNYIKSSNGLSTSSNSLYNKDQYDYLNDFVGALNASTNTYTPKINLGQNKKDYSVNRAISAINSARGGYSPSVNLSIGKDINRNIKF